MRERVVVKRGMFEQICQWVEEQPCSRNSVERLRLLDREGDRGGSGRMEKESHTLRVSPGPHRQNMEQEVKTSVVGYSWAASPRYWMPCCPS